MEEVLETRVCVDCGLEKVLNRSFPLVFGKQRSKRCYTCKQRINYRRNPQRFCERAKRYRLLNPVAMIVRDARHSDKKYGRENNLTKDAVAALLSSGCSYCGERQIRMTLDRVDNARGHTLDNVVSACIRCNMMRRDMPYTAWLAIVPSVRDARESGLFGDWVGGPHGRR